MCHVALGSYAESLNLLRMVLDDDDDGPHVQHQHQHGRQGGRGIPIDLVKVIGEYQAFVQQVLRVQQAASSSNADASTSAGEEGQAESMDIETVDTEADDTDGKAAGTTDEDDLPMPASAA